VAGGQPEPAPPPPVLGRKEIRRGKRGKEKRKDCGPGIVQPHLFRPFLALFQRGGEKGGKKGKIRAAKFFTVGKDFEVVLARSFFY